MNNLLTKHLNNINETYFVHLGRALYFSLFLLIASVACFIHAIFPFLFERTASNLVNEVHVMMACRLGETDENNETD